MTRIIIKILILNKENSFNRLSVDGLFHMGKPCAETKLTGNSTSGSAIIVHSYIAIRSPYWRIKTMEPAKRPNARSNFCTKRKWAEKAELTRGKA